MLKMGTLCDTYHTLIKFFKNHVKKTTEVEEAKKHGAKVRTSTGPSTVRPKCACASWVNLPKPL